MPSIDEVDDLTPRVQYTASTLQTIFDYPFPIFQDADLVVDVDGATKALDTDYTVEGEGDAQGGTITFTSPPGNGKTVTIYRDIRFERNTDYQQNGPWSAKDTNDELDKIFLILQQLKDADRRALRVPITSEASNTELDPTTWASTYLAFGPDGIPTPAALVPGTLTDDTIGAVLYPALVSEGGAAINLGFPYGHIRRYTNTLNAGGLQAAANANAGGTVYLSKDEEHIVSSPVVLPAGTNLRVWDNGTCTIDASAAVLSGSGLITSQGSISSSLGGGLAGAVAAGALSVVFNNSSHGLAAGDLIILRNTVDGSWNPASASYRQGEFLTVKSVSGATITLASRVIDSYADTCVVYKVTPTTTNIQGDITIVGNTADTANLPTVYLRFGRDNHISGLRFKHTTATCLEISTSYKPLVTGVDTGKLLTDAGSIQSTGVIFSGCQYGVCRDSVLVADRHGASTGGGGMVVDRFNFFITCFVGSRTAAAADFHGASQHCAYLDCTVDGACLDAGVSNRFSGCEIYPSANAPAMIRLDIRRSIDAIYEDNTFHFDGSVGYVIDGSDPAALNSDTTVAGVFRFLRNRIIDTTTGDHSYINIVNNGSTSRMQLHIEGNEVTKTDTAKYGNLLAVSAASGSNFARLIYAGQVHDNTGFGIVDDISSMRVSGSLGVGNVASASPAFGSTAFEPSEFDFEKRVNMASAGTAFTVLAVDSGHSFLPLMASGRCDTDITATTGNYLALGVNANNRRVDFGVFPNAAASSKHSKNSPLRFMNSSELGNQIVAAGEVLALLSVDASTDAAAIASNIGGSAGHEVTVRVAGRMIGNLPSLP